MTKLTLWKLELSLFLRFFGGLFLLTEEESSLKMSSFLCVLKGLFPFSLLVSPPLFHLAQDITFAEMRIQLRTEFPGLDLSLGAVSDLILRTVLCR